MVLITQLNNNEFENCSLFFYSFNNEIFRDFLSGFDQDRHLNQIIKQKLRS